MKLKMMRIGMVLAVLMSLIVMPAFAQFDSNVASTSLSYTTVESLSLSVNTPSLTLTTTPQPIVATAAYALKSSRTALGIMPYFATSSALQDSGSDTVPAANVLVTTQGAGEFPCNQTQGGSTAALFAGLGAAGSECVPYVLGSAWGSSFSGGVSSLQTTFSVRIDPSWTPSAIGVTYNGTLFFVAAAE